MVLARQSPGRVLRDPDCIFHRGDRRQDANCNGRTRGGLLQPHRRSRRDHLWHVTRECASRLFRQSLCDSSSPNGDPLRCILPLCRPWRCIHHPCADALTGKGHVTTSVPEHELHSRETAERINGKIDGTWVLIDDSPHGIQQGRRQELSKPHANESGQGVVCQCCQQNTGEDRPRLPVMRRQYQRKKLRPVAHFGDGNGSDRDKECFRRALFQYRSAG